MKAATENLELTTDNWFPYKFSVFGWRSASSAAEEWARNTYGFSG